MRWSERPTTLRPQFCDCELVYVLDEDEQDARARDASVRYVRLVVAHEQSKYQDHAVSRGLVSVHDHGDGTPMPHEREKHVDDQWEFVTQESSFCELHHPGEISPAGLGRVRDTIIEHTAKFHDTARQVADHFGLEPHEVSTGMCFESDGTLRVPLNVTSAEKRTLRGVLNDPMVKVI